MDWNNIISFIAGGLIAIIPVIVANRYQAKEKDKDRAEQRREARTQLTLELMRDNIKVIQDSINNYLKLIDELHIIKDKNLPTSRTDEAVAYDYLKDVRANGDKLSELYAAASEADKIALSLGERFFIEYQGYRDKCKNFINLAISSPSEFINDETSVESIIRSAGKLHAMMNEKLISLRDS